MRAGKAPAAGIVAFACPKHGSVYSRTGVPKGEGTASEPAAAGPRDSHDQRKEPRRRSRESPAPQAADTAAKRHQTGAAGSQPSARPLTTSLKPRRATAPGLGIATVYRTIHTMMTEGTLVVVEMPGEAPPLRNCGKGTPSSLPMPGVRRHLRHRGLYPGSPRARAQGLPAGRSPSRALWGMSPVHGNAHVAAGHRTSRPLFILQA